MRFPLRDRVRAERGSAAYPKCTHAGCTATTTRTVSSTYTNGFLTAVNGYADAITYHPNGQVNTVRHLNDPAVSTTWVTDTWYKDPQNQLRPNKIDAKNASGTVLWNSGVHTYDAAGNLTKWNGNTYQSYIPHIRDAISRGFWRGAWGWSFSFCRRFWGLRAVRGSAFGEG